MFTSQLKNNTYKRILPCENISYCIALGSVLQILWSTGKTWKLLLKEEKNEFLHLINDGLITSETEFLFTNSRMLTIVETYLRSPTNELQTEVGRTTTKKNRLPTFPCPFSFWHVYRNFHYACKIIQKSSAESDVYILVLKKYQKCLKYHLKISKGGKYPKSLKSGVIWPSDFLGLFKSKKKLQCHFMYSMLDKFFLFPAVTEIKSVFQHC